MIITKIIGGLGNQLFQYAAARCIAEKYGTNVKLDESSYNEYKLRSLELNSFHAKFDFATEAELASYHQTFINKIKNRVLPVAKRNVYKAPFFHFDNRFFSVSNNTYLKGYWQSEKYFLPVQQLIRQELTIKKEFVESLKDFAETLSRENSVSVHIRRGDYKDKTFSTFHGILPAVYYDKAFKILNNKINDARYYFFSDDIGWVKNDLNMPGATYISGTISKTHIEDFYLMSHCKHNIIANSSFSWWAAWLNNNPDKIVIAPKKWFNKGPQDTQDLIPEGWIKI